MGQRLGADRRVRVNRDEGTGTWVLLCYRLPREPSTPRITVWRNLKRLGIAQLADGLVTLPADARTREQLDARLPVIRRDRTGGVRRRVLRCRS